LKLVTLNKQFWSCFNLNIFKNRSYCNVFKRLLFRAYHLIIKLSNSFQNQLGVLTWLYFPSIEILIVWFKGHFINFSNEELSSWIDCIDFRICHFKVNEVLLRILNHLSISICLCFKDGFCQIANMGAIYVLNDQMVGPQINLIRLLRILIFRIDRDEHWLGLFTQISSLLVCQNKGSIFLC